MGELSPSPAEESQDTSAIGGVRRATVPWKLLQGAHFHLRAPDPKRPPPSTAQAEGKARLGCRAWADTGVHLEVHVLWMRT